MPYRVLERYRVEPGVRFDISSIDAGEKTLWEHLSKDDHEDYFDELRDELQHLQKVLYAQNKHRVLVVMQAMDTGGKDGCIKHVFSRVDPQGLVVASFKKPTEDEMAHDFLWRVHGKVPRNGQIVVFNRSHYEDVLAVRVKKLMDDAVWQRRYQHIIDFERMLAEEGTTIVKIFLHISKDEQKRRLESRLENPAKFWKFNPDDLQDRARWDDFMVAYEDLIGKTSMPHAPWYVIPADRKWYRNLCVAGLMAKVLEGLNMEFPKPEWDPASIHVGD